MIQQKNIKIYNYLHARGGLAAGDTTTQGDDGVADGGEPHHRPPVDGDEEVHDPHHQPLHKPVNNQLEIKKYNNLENYISCRIMHE
jgi:hypothetical protein